MSVNVGNLDRVLRAVAGLALIVLALASGLPPEASATLFYGALVVGLVLLGTATVRFCPLYRLIGVKTCAVQR
ncbi:MAG: DUF2892 domain-containing protein [Pseudomonadota bacterium]